MMMMTIMKCLLHPKDCTGQNHREPAAGPPGDTAAHPSVGEHHQPDEATGLWHPAVHTSTSYHTSVQPNTHSNKMSLMPIAMFLSPTQQLAESNQTIRERTSATDEMKHLLDSQKNNNKETNRKLIISRQQGMRFWRELKQQENSCNSLKNEVSFPKTRTIHFLTRTDSGLVFCSWRVTKPCGTEPLLIWTMLPAACLKWKET